MSVSGKCLCGEVEVRIKPKDNTFGACHCSMCRKWSGGPGLAVHAENGVEYTNAESVKLYSSSPWAERAFCKECGSHLFYKLKDGSYWNVPLGLLENQEEFNFSTQIYIDQKPSTYSFVNETNNLTEKQVLELFAAKE